jgi:UTP:GlnB (protein PII) uridylyltransferase
MTRPDYLNFSRVQGRENLNALVDEATAIYMKLLSAPEAAKENLMKTDYKIAVAAGNLVKSIIQAESANTMAMAVVAQRMRVDGDFIEANVPGLKVPKKQLRV